jgi:hypothetical protein
MPLDFARDIVHGKRVKREDKKIMTKKGEGGGGGNKDGEAGRAGHVVGGGRRGD